MTNYCALDCPDPASECFRTVALSVLFLLTLGLCLLQAFRFIRNSRRFISYQLLALYLAMMECLLGFLHWGFLPSTNFTITINIIKWFILLVIVYFFLHSSLLHFKKRRYVKPLLWPLFGLIILWLLIVWFLGIYYPADDCTDPTFLLMSGTGLILATVFFVTGVLLHRRMNNMSVSSNLRFRRKLELWALIFTYFLVALTSFADDIFSLSVYYQTNNCYLFEEGSWGDSLSVFFEHTWDLLVPLWALLIVFNIEARKERGIKKKARGSVEEEEEPLYDEYSFADYGQAPSYMAINAEEEEEEEESYESLSEEEEETTESDSSESD